MSFLDEFEGDGELSEEDVLDAKYLSSSAPGDFKGEVVSIKHDTHPENGKANAGQEFCAVILEAQTVKEGEFSKSGGNPRPIDEGDEVTMFLPMYTNAGKSRRKHLMRELIEALSAVSGDKEAAVRDDLREYLKNASAGEFDGNPVRAKTKPPSNGYHNWELLADAE